MTTFWDPSGDQEAAEAYCEPGIDQIPRSGGLLAVITRVIYWQPPQGEWHCCSGLHRCICSVSDTIWSPRKTTLHVYMHGYAWTLPNSNPFVPLVPMYDR